VRAVALFTALALASCNSSEPEQLQDPVSDASHDPGTNPVATNDLSAGLLIEEPAARRGYFASQMKRAGKNCPMVTEAVLKGGFEGSDFWRIRCTATGDWLVILGEGSPLKIANCKQSQDECRVAWESVSGT